MELLIEKKVLNHHLENISKCIIANSILPALNGILITAIDNKITLVASNGNLSMKENIVFGEETKVIDSGVVLVPGKLFTNIIKKQEKIIKIKVEDKILKISSNGFESTLNLLNHEEYPTISFEQDGNNFFIDSNEFTRIINNVVYAASENDRRIILNGVNLKIENKKFTATATNSYRLAQESININYDDGFEINIYWKNIKNFIPKKINREINININDQKIITSYDSSIIMSKLIDGVYPEVDKLIPKEFKYILEIDSETIKKMIEKATVVSEDLVKVIKMTISNEELLIESKKGEIGKTEIKEKENFKWEGDKFSIVFNSDFLKDAISKIEGIIKIKFISDDKPFLVFSNSNDKLTQLLLPHRSF